MVRLTRCGHHNEIEKEKKDFRCDSRMRKGSWQRGHMGELIRKRIMKKTRLSRYALLYVQVLVFALLHQGVGTLLIFFTVYLAWMAVWEFWLGNKISEGGPSETSDDLSDQAAGENTVRPLTPSVSKTSLLHLVPAVTSCLISDLAAGESLGIFTRDLILCELIGIAYFTVLRKYISSLLQSQWTILFYDRESDRREMEEAAGDIEADRMDLTADTTNKPAEQKSAVQTDPAENTDSSIKKKESQSSRKRRQWFYADLTGADQDAALRSAEHDIQLYRIPCAMICVRDSRLRTEAEKLCQKNGLIIVDN